MTLEKMDRNHVIQKIQNMSQVLDTDSLFETNSILAGNTGTINQIMENLNK
jgi:uncharacterized protein YjcR